MIGMARGRGKRRRRIWVIPRRNGGPASGGSR